MLLYNVSVLLHLVEVLVNFCIPIDILGCGQFSIVHE